MFITNSSIPLLSKIEFSLMSGTNIQLRHSSATDAIYQVFRKNTEYFGALKHVKKKHNCFFAIHMQEKI